MPTLRTLSTPRLAALCASAVAVVGGGTAIALAGSSGTAPAPKPLASAVHDALAAPATQGITARVKFTNHLIDSSGLQGQNPLLSGATGRLWLSPGKGLRLELQSDSGDAQIVANQKGFWVYDGTSNTVYRGNIPAKKGGAGRKHAHKVPSVTQIEKGLNKLAKRVHVSGATPGNVGGQPAYTVRVGPPNKPGGLLGAAELAFDAARGVPLRAALYARGNSTPVIELSATDVSYGAVPESTYSIDPPAGAKTVDVMPSGGARGGPGHRGKGARRHGKLVSGRAAVARKLPFQLSTPDTLAGRPRELVKLLKLRKGAAAIVTYGNGPGAIAVIERAESKNTAKPAGGDRHGKVQLPTVAIGGATGQVLDTPLGSVVQFSRAGVSYTVLGSVPAAVAEAAARGL